MSDLDDIDRRMIDQLRADGRMTAPQLAGAIGVGRATAYSRLDRLVDDGVITGFTAVVDPRKVGREVAALVLVNVEQGQWRNLGASLRMLPGVEWSAVTAGQFDHALLIRAESLDHLRDVALRELQEVEGVRAVQTIVLLDEHDHRARPLWPE